MSSFAIENNLEISSAEIERLRALVGWPNQAGYDKILAGSYSQHYLRNAAFHRIDSPSSWQQIL
jgi:hypothetical protein